MEAVPVRLRHRGVDVLALRAGPPGAMPTVVPGVLVVHDAWGLDDDIADLVAALAAAGFTVLAPDLLAGRRAADADEAGALVAGLDPEDAGLILATAADALGADPSTRPGAIGAIGVGMGAPLAAFLATVRPEIGVVVLAGPVPDLPLEAWARAEADLVVLVDTPDVDVAGLDAGDGDMAALDRARAAGRAVEVLDAAGDGPAGDITAAAIARALAARLGTA